MTHARLIEEVAAQIKEAVANVRLPLEYDKEPAPDDFVSVEVFAGFLPDDLFETTAYLPCVIVEYLDTDDDLKTGSRVSLGVSICVFALEADAWKDALNLLDIIRERILSKRLIAKRFRLKEAKFRTPNELPRQFFIITGEVSYEIYQPQDVDYRGAG